MPEKIEGDPGLTPHGVSGLKLKLSPEAAKEWQRLTPHGVSGLKSVFWAAVASLCPSHPARGEWIEIHVLILPDPASLSHPARGEWIEIFLLFPLLFPC